MNAPKKILLASFLLLPFLAGCSSNSVIVHDPFGAPGGSDSTSVSSRNVTITNNPNPVMPTHQ